MCTLIELAILAKAIIDGTDVFGAIILRPHRRSRRSHPHPTGRPHPPHCRPPLGDDRHQRPHRRAGTQSSTRASRSKPAPSPRCASRSPRPDPHSASLTRSSNPPHTRSTTDDKEPRDGAPAPPGAQGPDRRPLVGVQPRTAHPGPLRTADEDDLVDGQGHTVGLLARGSTDRLLWVCRVERAGDPPRVGSDGCGGSAWIGCRVCRRRTL
jgi:hypothetical protein